MFLTNTHKGKKGHLWLVLSLSLARLGGARATQGTPARSDSKKLLRAHWSVPANN